MADIIYDAYISRQFGTEIFYVSLPFQIAVEKYA